MRKNILVWVILCSLMAAQEVRSQALDLENIFPPSPTAAQIGKFATASVNYSDGAVAYAIPLYEYKTRNLSVPITLNYNTNGTRVTQVASRVGLGWNLDAGGVVSRTVLGEPDGASTALHAPPEVTEEYKEEWETFLLRAGNEGNDSQPDIFTFSFGGYSGKFIIDSSRIFKLTENNLKIEGGIAAGFTITTPDGAKYEFKQEESSVAISSCAKNTFSRVPIVNAWYLTQVSHPEGDIIYIKYGTCDYSYYSSTSQVMSYGAGGGEVCSAGCPAVPAFQECQVQIRNYGVYPTIITSNGLGTVRLGYTARQDLIGDFCLSSLIVLDTIVARTATDVPVTQGKIRTAYELGYLYSSAGASYRADIGKRMFLGSVQELKMGPVAEVGRSYGFQYDNINGLPARNSTQQDYMGYYNGQSGRTLIMEPNDPTLYNYFQSYGFGNRRPNWSFSKLGALKRIIFPGGGYEDIEYEAHTIPATTQECLPVQSENVYVEGTSEFHQAKNYFSVPFTVACGQQITLTVGNVIITPNYPDNTYLTTACLSDGPGDPCGGGWSAGGGQHNVFTITTEGTHVLAIKVQGPSRGYASLNYAPLDTSRNKEIPGVRVKAIRATDPLTGKQSIKRFYYNKAQGISTGVAVNTTPYNRYDYNRHVLCPGGSEQCLTKACRYTQLTSSSYYDLYSYTGNHIYYTYVLESNGENMENGGIEREFSVFFDQTGNLFTGRNFPGAPLSYFSYANGQKVAERVFTRENGVLKLIREENNHYGTDQRFLGEKAFYAVKNEDGAFKCVLTGSIGDVMSIKGVNTIRYVMNNRWERLDSSRVTTYDKNQGALSVLKTFAYDNTVHQYPTLERVTDSKGQVVETQRWYANDNITGLTPSESTAKQALVDLNIKGALLQEKVLRNGSQVSLVKNNYAIFNSNMPLLANIDAQYGNGPLEKRIFHERYDATGNLLTQYKLGGPKMSYIWDYNYSLPIAQCTNADVTDIAYTSFEANTHGNWILGNVGAITPSGITGNNSYNLAVANLVKSGLQSGKKYIVSYWAKTGTVNVSNATASQQGANINGWTYAEKVVTGTTSVTISGNAIIDELRLYPEDGQMVSYTYLPLAGVISQSDVGNKIVYYEYDALGRLKLSKDQYGKVLKLYDYQYQKPLTQ